MDEIQSANAHNSEAVSAAKGEITAVKKELQTLGIALQALITQVSVYMVCICIYKHTQSFPIHFVRNTFLDSLPST